MTDSNIKKERIKKKVILLIFIALTVISFFISIGNGAVKVHPKEIINAVFFEKSTVNYQIIWNVRLPRTIVAALVGTCLALSGAILQGVMRNPLAAPNIIGVSSGAGLMTLLILILFPDFYYLAPIGAFIGALLATLFIYFLAWKEGVVPTRLILAGVAVSSLLGAGTNALMTFYPNKVAGVIGFMVGGLSSTTWQQVKIIFPYAAIGIFLILLIPNKLNILMMGDEVATSLGLNVERTRFAFIIISSLLAGSAVSVVGLLGFVGLIVPHMTRLFIGSDYRYLLPAVIFTGATVVMLCDTLARVMFAPMEIPVGIIMSALGAPFFLYLLRRKKEY
ncbi:FecCD family ABC transporter permease [Sporanaerobacter sp. PP17-6a]|jgi:iron complex transport system permease protein|uniref:FecCD family ABC transporter permease n=1 Tax=Sporanaerobacter sp. PP17-6a TaxID=1891289 RepID=UPI0008A07208|nr:iron ABC transporter permease [Sporanaerobacter sp. PP17-6a]MBE6083009.1 iron ABC transporter permease [Tissierellaceae bacterium]SCL88565.1 putative siderophore transport system permease protein YfhA [Sporanaerobacter sp. PP17-6a]